MHEIARNMGMYRKRRLKKIAKRCNLNVESFWEYMKDIKRMRKLGGFPSHAGPRGARFIPG